MSSFVIGKEEYVKAAGIIAGIVDASNRGISECFVFDYQRDRRMTEKDFYDCFVELFQMNALSVHEYYGPRHPEDELYTDSNDYQKTFKEFQKIGRAAALDPGKLQRIIFNLRDFFRSAQYQTMESNAYFFKMKMIFDNILVSLMGLIYPHECECWGSFEV